VLAIHVEHGAHRLPGNDGIERPVLVLPFETTATSSARKIAMNPIRRSIPIVAALLTVFAAPLSAQLPDWATLKSSSPTLLFAEASVVVVQDAAGYHVYSAYTRTWSDLKVSSNAEFYGYDDHVVIVDGTTAWGFATRSGAWSKLTLNESPTVLPPPSGAVWLTVLLERNGAHVFSGLLGTWTSMEFSSTPYGMVGRMVAVVSNGTKTVAVSAHFGTAVELGIPNITTIAAVGYCGAARDTTNYHVFSAYRNRWRSIPAGPGAILTKPPSRAGYLVVQEPNSMTFYSALTDNQVVLYHGTQTIKLTTKENVAAVEYGNAVLAYSCATGTMDVATTTSTSGWSSVDVQQEVVVAADNTNVHAFGLLAGSFAPPIAGTVVGVNAGTALAKTAPYGDYAAFSCMTNKWATAPAGNYQGNHVIYNGVVLIEASGKMQGFSANCGTWTSQTAPKGDSYYDHKAAFCARSGTRLDTFNGRTGEWRTVTTSTQATVTCFDMAVMADDGKNLYCYCCYCDDWSSWPCVAKQSELRDQCAMAYDGATVHVWSGMTQVSEWANIPEYWRILARGGKLHYNVAGEPGSPATVAIGISKANLLTPFGTLRVDLASAVLLSVQIPNVGTGVISLIVPDIPSLKGVTLYAQGLIAPAKGAYLTGYFESTIM